MMNSGENGFAYKNEKITYECPYCKKKYESPRAMANCILSCESKQEALERERKYKELQEQKAMKRKAIEDQWKKAKEEQKKAWDMEQEYYNTYGEKVFSFDLPDLSFDKFFKTLNSFFL